MTPARMTFVIVLGLSLAFGLVIGLINLVNPEAVSITLNDQKVTGMAGFGTAVGAGVIGGLCFGLVITGIVALVTRKRTVH